MIDTLVPDIGLFVVESLWLSLSSYCSKLNYFTNIVWIEELENVGVEAVDAETLDVTWDLPAGLEEYNIPVVHHIEWASRSWDEHLRLANVMSTRLFQSQMGEGDALGHFIRTRLGK